MPEARDDVIVEYLPGETLVYDQARDTSDFHILDAATLEQQARITLPRRVPQGFHGSWCPGF